MIRCENCGATLHIKDEHCAYCDSANPFFEKHREDMETYEKKFTKTKKEVVEQSKNNTKKIVSMLIMFVLMSINIVVISATSQVQELCWWLEHQEVASNLSTHKQNLDLLEAEGDYLGFVAYMTNNNLYYEDQFDEYYAVRRCSEAYEWIFEGLMRLNYDEELHESSYDFWVEIIAESICDIYEKKVPYDYCALNEYSDTHVNTMDGILEQSKALLKEFTNIPHSSIDDMEDLSKAKLMILIEEGIPYEKK